MFRRSIRLFLSMAFAVPLLMAAAASAPASAQGMADDTACVLAGLLGEEFGLCNAYCEAMDCDGDTPQASAKACEKVRAKFEAIEGAPELPCLPDPSLNDPPTLDLDFADTGTYDTTATFVSFGDAVPIAVNVEITDSDGDLIVSATVTLTNAPDDPNETLSLSPAGHDLLDGLIYGDVTGEGTDALLITGDGTLAQYSEILQEVVYDNALGDPDTTARIIVVEVDDGFIDGFSDATSVMAVAVGCPCPSFSSDAIVSTSLKPMFEPAKLNVRGGCDPFVSSCLNGPLVSSCVTETVVDNADVFGKLFRLLFDSPGEGTRSWAMVTRLDSRLCFAEVSSDSGGFGLGSVVWNELRQVSQLQDNSGNVPLTVEIS